MVDDYKPVRQGIVSLVSRQPGYVVCGEAQDGLEAITRARAPAGMVFMDVTMPHIDGLDATRRSGARSCRRVMIVSQNDPRSCAKARHAGAEWMGGKAEVGARPLMH